MTAISMSRRQALLGHWRQWPEQQHSAHCPCRKRRPRPRSPRTGALFYRFTHGKMQATVVSDGILPLGEPSGSFLGSSKEEIGKMLTDNFLSPSNVVLEQNILVLNTGDKLVLFDTGMGTSSMFGPTPGKLLREPQGCRHRSQGHRRRGGDARPLRPRLGHHGGRRQPQFPQRADLHLAGRLRFLDRRGQAGHERSSLHEAVRGGRAQEPASQPRPHRVLQGRTGVPAGHPGDGGARPYRRPHGVHDHLRRQDRWLLSAISRTTR